MTLNFREVSELPRLMAWRGKGALVTVKGVELFYIATPDFSPTSTSSMPRLLILHGYPTASFDFWKVYDKLQEKFEVLCWDFAGFGFSEKVYRPIAEQIDLLEALLQDKGFATKECKLDLHILSHDLGDTLVQEMMSRRQAEKTPFYSIKSVVMLNGGILPHMHRPNLMQKLMLVPGINYVLASFFNISLFKKSISKVFGPDTKPTDEEIQEYYALVQCNCGQHLITENIQYMTERKVHCDRWVIALKQYAAANPFLLIDGPADPVSGKHLAEAVRKEIDGVKVVLLEEKIGHWPQVEAPNEMLEAFFDFHTEIQTFSL